MSSIEEILNFFMIIVFNSIFLVSILLYSAYLLFARQLF